MASRGSENGVPAPVNDSIDELLDGLPAEPMLPKRRAKPIDHSAPPPSQRRLEDQVVVRAHSDPPDHEISSQGSSTAGSALLRANATRQRAIVAVLMMIGVLGIYAFVRHAKRGAAPVPAATTAQNGGPTAAATMTTVTTALAPDAVPRPPIQNIVATSPTPTAKSAAASTHKTPKPHADSHAPPPPPAAPPTASANTRTDVARSL